MAVFLPIWLLADIDNSSSQANQVPSESKEWTGYSAALHILLPVAGFCILWGRRDLLTRVLLQIDRSCISVFCPSFSKREKLLKWASENLPCTWSSPSRTLSGGIPDLWKDGSLLCTLINMAVPGACSNPPKHWKKPPTHAQALAYKYLGIIPIFTESDFEGTFSPIQERKFLIYLQELQQAIKKYNADDNRPNVSSDYLAKGMGLHTGEQHRKITFYIYSNTTSSNCNNILVYIRGPYGTQGTATVPAFHNLNSLSVLNYLHKQFRASDKIMYKKEPRKSFLKSIALDFTTFVNLEKKVLANDIPIHVEMEHDRAKITYIPNNFGIYEINLITNGEVLNGSPFTASVTENVLGIRESFESTEKILKELPAIKKKKIISRFIDCIDEKIQLRTFEDNIYEKPVFEKIASVSVITDEADSMKSEVSLNKLAESLPHAVIQYEVPQVAEKNCETVDALERIQEHQDENETDLELFKKERRDEFPSGNSSMISEEKSVNFSHTDTLRIIPILQVSLSEDNNKHYEDLEENSSPNNEKKGLIISSSNSKPQKNLPETKTEYSPKVVVSSFKTPPFQDEMEGFFGIDQQNIIDNKRSIQPSSIGTLVKMLNHVDQEPVADSTEECSNVEEYHSQSSPSFTTSYSRENEGIFRNLVDLDSKTISVVNNNQEKLRLDKNNDIFPLRSACEVKNLKVESFENNSIQNKKLTNEKLGKQIQKRPTSIVSPFFKVAPVKDKSSDESSDQSKLEYSTVDQISSSLECRNNQEHFLSTTFEDEMKKALAKRRIFQDSETYSMDESHENNSLKISRKESLERKYEVNESPLVYSVDNSSNSIQLEKEFEPEVLLLDLRQNNRKIENRFVDNLKAILANNMFKKSDDSKKIKDFVNTKNKLKNLNNDQMKQDKNNNKYNCDASDSNITSPICADHIVPEVEPPKSSNFGNLSVSEKRRLFTRQHCTSMSSSNNTSVSEKETEDVPQRLNEQKYSLSVLSVIDTIKKSTNSYGLNRGSSKSVPDISKSENTYDENFSSGNYRTSFLKTREYWKNISSQNSSSNSSSRSSHYKDYDIKIKNKTLTKSTELSPNMYKSADDILSISNRSLNMKRLQRYSSLDQKEFETLEFISLDERKRMLLQDQYDKENLGSRFIKKQVFTRIRNIGGTEDGLSNVEANVMKNLDEAVLQKSSTFTEEKPTLHSTSNSKRNENENKDQKPLSQFKRSIAFFKNLENSSTNKNKVNYKMKKHPEIRRRFSLNYHKRNLDKPKIGGSLRLPKTSEKFFVNRIYFDIMGNKRGSFKGLPNRNALSKTLESLSTENDPKFLDTEPDNSIQYNMFFNRHKTKKRKSIKSVFNIHY